MSQTVYLINNTMSLKYYLTVSLMLIGISLILSGCGTSKIDTENEYAAWVDDIKASGLYASDFVKGVVSDGVITDAEYLEARQLYAECLSSQGFQVELNGGGSSMITLPDSTDELEADRIEGNCATEYIMTIEAFYFDMQKNPNNEDWYQLIGRCLIHTGFADVEYSQDDLWAYMDKNDVWDPRVDACTDDPVSVLEEESK